MLLNLTKKYISQIQLHQITNEFLITLLLIIEYLPLIYHIVLSSFYCMYITPPSFITSYLQYISYYKLFTTFTKNYPMYVFIITILISFSFIIYKYIILNFMKQPIFSKFFVNFYEFFVFRILSIFIFDIIVNKIIFDSIVYSFISVVVLILTVIGFAEHFSMTHVLLSKNNIVDSELTLINDRYLLYIKMFLAFSINYQKDTKTVDNDPLFIFLNFSVVLFMYILVIHTIYLLLFQRYTFTSNKISIRLRIILNLILTIASLYIILIRNFDKVNLIIFVISEIPFALLIENYL